MKCPNCNTNLPDDSRFCGECGQKMEPVTETCAAGAFCSKCGAPIQPGEAFCGSCGAQNTAAVPKNNNGNGKKAITLSRKTLCGLGIVAAVIAVILVISLFAGGSDNHVVYLKDSQLQCLQLPKGKEAHELTRDVLDGRDMDNAEFFSFAFHNINDKIRFSSDGKTLFFPDKVSYDQYTLYYQDITSSKSEAVKLDSGLTGGYDINNKGSLVTYIKDGKLYQHDLKEKTKIASDVTDFNVSEDGKTLLYMVDDGDDYRLYLKKGSKDAQKVASGVTSVVHISEDLSSVFYKKDDTLYSVKNGKEPQKIASDVSDVWKAYDSGACYYIKKDGDDVSIWSLIDDDVGGTESEYAKERYRNETIANPVSELYYYDGKTSTLITKNAIDFIACSSDTEVLVCTALAGDELPQIKLSEHLDTGDSIVTMTWERIAEESAYMIAQEGQFQMEFEDISGVSVAKDGKKLLVATDIDDDDGSCSMYEVVLSGGKIKSSGKIDDDVSYASFVGNSEYIYWKDVDENYEGALYFNGEKVADDTQEYMAQYDEDTGNLYYMTDYNTQKSEGTLVCWNGRKNITIQEDVHLFTTCDNSVLYLHDFSTKSSKGDLSVWNGRKSTKLDDDVVAIVAVNDPG